MLSSEEPSNRFTDSFSKFTCSNGATIQTMWLPEGLGRKKLVDVDEGKLKYFDVLVNGNLLDGSRCETCKRDLERTYNTYGKSARLECHDRLGLPYLRSAGYKTNLFQQQEFHCSNGARLDAAQPTFPCGYPDPNLEVAVRGIRSPWLDQSWNAACETCGAELQEELGFPDDPILFHCVEFFGTGIWLKRVNLLPDLKCGIDPPQHYNHMRGLDAKQIKRWDFDPTDGWTNIRKYNLVERCEQCKKDWSPNVPKAVRLECVDTGPAGVFLRTEKVTKLQEGAAYIENWLGINVNDIWEHVKGLGWIEWGDNWKNGCCALRNHIMKNYGAQHLKCYRGLGGLAGVWLDTVKPDDWVKPIDREYKC